MTRLAGLVAIALAAWWSWRAWRNRPRAPAPLSYPNEWGVRLEPLSRAELERAIAAELDVARRLAEVRFDNPPDAPVSSALPAAQGVLAGPQRGR